MKAYSNDLRRKIIAAYENNDYSQQQVADLFGVSPATVRNLVRRQRETGSPDALPHAGGKPPALPDQARLFVQELVKENNDLTLAELRLKVERKHKQKVSLPTLCRVLQALGLPRKKSRSTPPNETRRVSSRRASNTSKRSADSI
jgi:transposase